MSCSQTSRATNCATPRLVFSFVLLAAVRCASCCRYRIALRNVSCYRSATAATPFSSLLHPQGALGNVPSCATPRLLFSYLCNSPSDNTRYYTLSIRFCQVFFRFHGGKRKFQIFLLTQKSTRGIINLNTGADCAEGRIKWVFS